MAHDLGQRLRAARAYAGLEIELVADAIGLTAPALGRIEAGVEPLKDSDRRAVIGAVAGVTRLPEQFFTVSYAELRGEETPESMVHALGAKVDTALERMNEVVAKAEEQMTRGKHQLDRFVAHQHVDRDLLRKIGERVGVDVET